MGKIEDVQSRLLLSRETAEAFIREAKDKLYELVKEGEKAAAKEVACKIEIYQAVLEATWPYAKPGVIRELAPKHNWDYGRP